MHGLYADMPATLHVCFCCAHEFPSLCKQRVLARLPLPHLVAGRLLQPLLVLLHPLLRLVRLALRSFALTL